MYIYRFFLLAILFTFINHSLVGQRNLNIIFKGSIFNPLVASGHMFEESSRPDGEYGFSLGTGLAYFNNQWIVSSCFNTYFQKYHFHYLEESEGYFYSAYFQGAISIYRKINWGLKNNNIVLYAGTGISAHPFISQHKGWLPNRPENYQTSITFIQKFCPIGTIGIGRSIWKGKIVWLLSTQIAIQKNYIANATIYFAKGPEHVHRTMRDVKFMFSIDYFPFANSKRKIRKKSNYFLRNGKRKININNCPVK